MATGTDSGSAPGTRLASGLGEFALYLVDQPAPEATEIWVTITSVTAHVAGTGWVPLELTTNPFTIDLLKLADHAEALGFRTIPPGKVTQIRLLLAEEGHHVTVDGAPAPLKVPSGYQSGIKIIGNWDVTSCSRTAVTIDFDGNKSIWYHPTGQGEQWILRPVIRVRSSETTPITCPPAPGEPPPDGGSGGETPVGPGGSCSATSACVEGLSCVEGICTGEGGDPSSGGDPAGGTGGEIGDACSPEAACAESLACVGGTCLVPYVGACAASTECSTGSCVYGTCGPGGVSASCGKGDECLSGVCDGGTCAAGTPSAPCAASSDCTTGICTEGKCGVGTTGGSGAACLASVECTSNVCSGGTCQPGYQGSLCSVALDCQTGLTCESGTCVPAAL
jgi:hypothetical protein